MSKNELSIAKDNYIANYNDFMREWEVDCRNWFEEEKSSVKFSFFKDGVIDPEIWFKNDFRPLFVLKEVHDNPIENRSVDFVAMQEGKDYDIWNRTGKGMWRSLGALAKGIITSIENNGEIVPYEKLYAEDLEEYREVLRRISIINIKKISGGEGEDSELSIQTKHFTRHACKFKDDLKKQIEQINPSVIICCGADIRPCFDIEDNKLFGIPVVFGLHPATNPNRRREKFYNETIEKVYKMFS